MLYLMWFFSIFSIGFYIFEGKKNKTIKQFTLLIVFIFLFIMLGWARGAYDVEIGIRRYDYFQFYESYTEFGYSFFIEFAHQLGWNYRSFFVFWAFIELIVMFWFVERNTKNSPIVFGLFLLWPLTAYFQYTRSICAFTFILIGLDYLLNNRKKGVIIYLICIALAMSIHFSSIMFSMYLLTYYFDKKKIAIFTISGFLILLFASNIPIISDYIILIAGETRSNIVSNSINASGTFGRIFGILLYIMSFFVLYFVLTKVLRLDLSDRKTEMMYNINTLSFMFIPLTLKYGLGVARIVVLLSFVNYVFFVDKISLVKSQKKRILLYVLVLLFILSLMFINARNIEYRQAVITPYFEKNELINDWF